VDPTARFAGVLALLFVINLTGFVMEACRLAVVKPWWAGWSPVGYLLGQAMLGSGMGEGALRATHLGVWLFHAAISLFFIAIIPRSYFVHLVTTPLNVFFSKLTPRGEIKKIENIEEAESLGVSKLEEFSWKRRLDFDACVECGRCQAACPAYLAGSALSPSRSSSSSSATCMASCPGPDPRRADQGRRAVGLHHLHGLRAGVPGLHRHRGHHHRPAALPHAVRGRAAVDRAAVAAEHPARRAIPGACRPPSAWRGPGLDVPMLEPGKEVEYLYWVGCSASYDRRNQAIARSVVAI
jgi:hypothetical protein